MPKKMDKRIKIFISTIVISIVGGALLLVGMNFSNGSSNNKDAAKLTADSFTYNFGTISMVNGLASHTFIIKNEGGEDLKLSEISTSCMCTSAYLEAGGDKSPKFGMHNNPAFWSKKIPAGETANLEVIFDPLAHGPDAVGPITRSVQVFSNDGGRRSLKKFTITGNVVK